MCAGRRGRDGPPREESDPHCGPKQRRVILVAVEIAELSGRLTFHPHGYWTAGPAEAISSPPEGNDLFFSIEDGSFWFQHRNRVIVEAVRQFPPGGPVFDVGGGNGFVAMGLERAGFPAVVIEPGPAGAVNACRRGLRNVLCVTVEAAGCRPWPLSSVGLFDVLEHIEDDVAFLRSLRRLLKPGGRLYVTVPAFPPLWSAEDEHAGHFRRYTRRSLNEVLERGGFRAECLTYFF